MITVTKNLETISVFPLAEYILIKCGKMSHLKLQKLLYYVQALHLAYFDTELITDEFEAWVHGPVCRALYDTVKDRSILYDDIGYSPSEGEPNPIQTIQEKLSTDQIAIIDEVLKNYGVMSGIDLEVLSHSEEPWLHAREGYYPADRCNVAIDKGLMKSFYKKFLL